MCLSMVLSTQTFINFTFLNLRDLIIVTLCKKLKIRNYTAIITNYNNFNIYLTNLKLKRGVVVIIIVW